MPQTTREIHLAARPQGEPKPSDFRLVERELPDPSDGQLLVRNTWMSVDPYMRGRMDDRKSYAPPYELDAPLYGGAVGEVVASGDPRFRPGALVVHYLGWREHALVDAEQARVLGPDVREPRHALGVLGMPGLTAYVGLLDIAALREGDVVFVSAAAGAVGSVAGQIAKLRGHTVIGSAGTAEKVASLRGELGFAAAFDYHDEPVSDRLREAARDGIDVYFDNVGGAQLEAAIGAMRNYGRIALCGSISGYNDREGARGPRNMSLATGKRLTLRGFIVGDHEDRRADFEREVGAWLHDGSLVYRETIVDGLDHAPDALIALLRGANTGKMLVRLA
jgi:NADPH-dependent curcumin reductase CurA